MSAFGVGALVMFLASIAQSTTIQRRLYWPVLWLAVLMALTASYYESRAPRWGETPWQTAVLESAICLSVAWLLWRASGSGHGYGGKLLAGAFTLLGLNNLDRFQWTHGGVSLIRFAS